MPGSAHLKLTRQRPVLLVAGAVACLAACSAPVDIPEVELDPAADRECKRLVAALPEELADESRRESTGGVGAAYGDPPIIIRCGVPPAAELQTTCMSVDGIDWYADEEGDIVVATTAGREPAVELRVPASYGSSNAALVDIGPTVREHTTAGRGC